MHRQRADVAARKFERLHREAVGRDHHLAAVEIDRRRIGLDVEVGRAEVARENLLDQFAHETPAIAVRQRNAFVFHQRFRAATCAAWP